MLYKICFDPALDFYYSLCMTLPTPSGDKIVREGLDEASADVIAGILNDGALERRRALIPARAVS